MFQPSLTVILTCNETSLEILWTCFIIGSCGDSYRDHFTISPPNLLHTLIFSSVCDIHPLISYLFSSLVAFLVPFLFYFFYFISLSFPCNSEVLIIIYCTLKFNYNYLICFWYSLVCYLLYFTTTIIHMYCLF